MSVQWLAAAAISRMVKNRHSGCCNNHDNSLPKAQSVGDDASFPSMELALKIDSFELEV
jgi:hypothetical protein